MVLRCLLCGFVIEGAATFVSNDDPSKGAAHLECANAQKPS